MSINKREMLFYFRESGSGTSTIPPGEMRNSADLGASSGEK